MKGFYWMSDGQIMFFFLVFLCLSFLSHKHLHTSLSASFRAAFAKESEVLTGNLGDKLIPQNEILRDVSDLKALANLHESMEWLAGRLKTFFSNLPQAASK